MTKVSFAMNCLGQRICVLTGEMTFGGGGWRTHFSPIVNLPTHEGLVRSLMGLSPRGPSRWATAAILDLREDFIGAMPEKQDGFASM